MKHVVHFSTGAGSAEVAYRITAKHGAENTVLLTADTLVEDQDNWRFARQVVDQLGNPEWVILADGRTPMQVGRDHKAVPNNRMAICSRILKREILRHYIDKRFDPDTSIHYLGFDWTEPDRHDAAAPNWLPYKVVSPLISPPYISKPDLLNIFRDERGIEPPRLYRLGFHHANCGGACVRGGQAQWQLLLRVNRPLYLEWEDEEETTRTMLNKNVTILRDRYQRPGKSEGSRPISLKTFRERIESQPGLFDADDWGACGCTDELRVTP